MLFLSNDPLVRKTYSHVDTALTSISHHLLIYLPLIGSGMVNSNPVTIGDILDKVIYWVYADCKWGEPGPHCKSKGSQSRTRRCSHLPTLFNCLVVNSLWYFISVKHLWRHYATFKNLASLINSAHSEETCVSKIVCCPHEFIIDLVNIYIIVRRNKTWSGFEVDVSFYLSRFIGFGERRDLCL
jgi:hypothetical protein